MIYVAPWTVMLPGAAIMISVCWLTSLATVSVVQLLRGWNKPLLDIRNLTIEFKTGDEWVKPSTA